LIPQDRAERGADAKDVFKIGLQVGTLVVAVAAVVTAINSGEVAKHGQDQAVVEFKDNLVHELVDPTSDVLMSARFIVSGTEAIGSGLGARQANQQEYLRLEREWAKARAEVNAILASAHESTQGWLSFSGDVAAYLALSYGDFQARRKAFNHLKKRPHGLNPQRDIKKCTGPRRSWLRPHRARAMGIHFQCAYDALAANLRARLHRLVVKLINRTQAFA
jgi:hypothetical protein